ncbi:hypothetical protein [Streptomyces violascens]|uniref:hypothetical protein n=1 Tax=Streptomyces violascens TaxID=67381 RepID=UPI00367D16A5
MRGPVRCDPHGAALLRVPCAADRPLPAVALLADDFVGCRRSHRFAPPVEALTSAEAPPCRRPYRCDPLGTAYGGGLGRQRGRLGQDRTGLGSLLSTVLCRGLPPRRRRIGIRRGLMVRRGRERRISR